VARNVADRAARLWRSDDRWLVLLVVAYLVARVVVLANATIFTSFDTASYSPRADAALNHGPVLSFTGHAPRLWGAPLFYALFPDDWWRAAGQWALGTVAWATLAGVVWTLCRRTPAKIVGAAAVLLLALLQIVGSLDFTILSESLTVSLGVLVFALLVRWLATGSRRALVGMSVAAFWWTFTRPDIRVFTVIVIVVLAACAWRAPVRRVAALVAAGSLAVAAGWCTAIGPVAAASFAQWGALHTNQTEELFLVRLRVDVFGRPYVREVFTGRLGMPPCPGADRVAANADWALLEFSDEYHRCPELERWGEQNMDDVFRRFALTAPAQYVRLTYEQVGEALARGSYDNVPPILPQAVTRAAVPGHRWAVPWGYGLLALAIAGAVAAGAYRARRVAAWSATLLAAACTVSVVAVASAAGAQYWRYGVQEMLGLRIALIMLAALVLDRVLERRAGAGASV